MRHIITFLGAGILAITSIQAQNTDKHGLIDRNATPKTQNLFRNLKEISGKHILFGQQDATSYGHSWRTGENRSDVKDICGSHPAVIGADFGGLESFNPERVAQAEKNLHKVITETYRRGGVITICWHAENPVSGDSFYFKEKSAKAVSHLIPGGSHHKQYKQILQRIARVAQAIKGDRGELIPVIFRPFHEFDGDWFWWGEQHCTKEEFITLWQFTVNYLKDTLQVHNFIYAFSPDCRFTTEDEYLQRYPGDEFVDLLGMDDYWDFRPDGANNPCLASMKLKIVSDLAQKREKIAALTETGLESVIDPNWFSKTLLPILKSKNLKIAYALVWRNAHDSETHYYTPFPGHPAEKDFISFYKDKFTWFEEQLPNLYK